MPELEIDRLSYDQWQSLHKSGQFLFAASKIKVALQGAVAIPS